jgi:methylglutaconyl-CoA hydratase
MSNQIQPTVTIAKNRGIATIEFFHPAHNSLPSDILEKLIIAFENAGNDPEIVGIVLKSAGERTFCAGASFDELAAIEDLETGKHFFGGFGRVINAMRKCPKPIIGRIHGRAIGGGVGLAAATDFCVATIFATIRLSELAVGFGPFVIGPAVERKVGSNAFTQLALTPDEWQTADWAKKNGLFSEVFDKTEQMDAYIEHLCEKWRNYSPEALRELKAIFWKNTEHWDTLLDERAAISGRLALTDFAKNAIAAFKAK